MAEVTLHDGSTMRIEDANARRRRERSDDTDAVAERATPKPITLPVILFENRSPSGETVKIEADQIKGVGVIRFRRFRDGVTLDEFCFDADHLPFMPARVWHEKVIKGAWRVGFLPDHMVMGQL